jgi:hypothetical protein
MIRLLFISCLQGCVTQGGGVGIGIAAPGISPSDTHRPGGLSEANCNSTADCPPNFLCSFDRVCVGPSFYRTPTREVIPPDEDNYHDPFQKMPGS